jgi:hypothetical protein
VGRGQPAFSTCETDQTIGGLNGGAGSTRRNDAILGSGIVVFLTRRLAGASGIATIAVKEFAHKAAHCPWEQQKSQLLPSGMLLHGTSTGK